MAERNKVNSMVDWQILWSEPTVALRHIMVVGGEPEMASSLATTLERENPCYLVTIVSSEEEALAVLDLVVVDLFVVVKSTVDLHLIDWMRRVRSDSPRTRVLLIARGGNGVARATCCPEVDCSIAHPFDMDELTRAVHRELFPAGEQRTWMAGQRARAHAISTIFHELRMPLTFITGYAELLAVDGTPAAGEWVENVRRHACHLRHVLDDVTRMVEWSVGQMPLRTCPVDVCAVLESVVAQLTPLAVEHNMTLHLLPSPGPVWVSTDEWLLGILAGNLISAVVTQSFSQKRTEVQVELGENAAVITVYGDLTIDQVCSGAGISLDMVRVIGKLLGGSFRIRPEQDSKTAFSFTMPLNCEA